MDKTHGPIQDEYKETMNVIARALDEAFNGPLKGHDRKVAFVLLTANFGDYEGGRVNYIANGERDDIISMMKELIGRFESRVSDETGNA